MFRKSFRIAVVVSLVLVPAVALADAYGNLVKARNAFEAAKSWHAVEQVNGRPVTLDYAAPDRWRIQVMPNITDVIIGRTAYMVRDGRSVRLPMVAPRVWQMVKQNWIVITPEVKRTLLDRGMRTIGGVRVHVYTFTANGNPVTAEIGGNDLPVRASVRTPKGTVNIRYSRYNAPISIRP